jgi:hypothetical protein
MSTERLKKIKEKVLFVLNKYPFTRNDDAQLTFQIIQEYYPEEMYQDEETKKWYISTNALKLIREDNVKRCRCVVQNVEKLFLPTDPKIRKKRNIQEDTWLNYIREENLNNC